ncbi:GAF domain-containing protein [Curtobacterium sp. VKM Ac-1395]|uniref:GAF domain-containing protein n=1 Tax=Curtobacterium sp. VKM Ac-1395 TaxID=2783815 RepID=UPI00188C9596|nr:GAF domain-containing protein [Curtobacterium sp. VKM Ac-1395]MBF4590268.1 GAF domain-containing protein [Curtobacterium sp. VKM Ac-1395]
MNPDTTPSATTVSASGLDPDRVLVLGDALAPHGVGRSTGARLIADELAASTGRGTDVTATAWWSSGSGPVDADLGVDTSTYDVVLLAVPERAVQGQSPSHVVLSVTTLIDAVRPGVDRAAVFVVAIPGGADRGFLAAAVQASGPGIVALAVDSGPDGRPRVIEVVRAVLAEQRARTDSPQGHRDAPQQEQRRYDALDRLGILDTPGEERFDRIVDGMRRLFRTQGAAINFLPEGRQWTKSGTWNASGDTALEDSFCRTTVTGAGPMVVGDAWHDAGGLPRNAIRFYAGHPIETLDGVRVGAVCVFDPAPRSERTVEVDLLRDFAVLARTELYR